MPAGSLTLGRFLPCPRCGVEDRAVVFPAVSKRIEAGRPGEAVQEAGEAGCFQHPDKRAEAACDGCGRFLCGLCRLPFEGRDLCPACLERVRAEGDSVVSHRFCYDRIALSMSLLPLLIWPITAVTAPATLFFVYSFWNRPGSLVRGNRPHFLFAAFLAGLQVLAWSWVAAGLVQSAWGGS